MKAFFILKGLLVVEFYTEYILLSMNMAEKNTCVLSYSSAEGISEALRLLQAEKFNFETVSIVVDANIHQKKLRQLLNENLFSVMTEQNSIMAMGSIVCLMVKEHDDIDIHDFSVLGFAFFSMGIAVDNISQYEAEVKAGNFLLIINAASDEVERSCEILHHEMQQVTVHLA
ncbi:hypothetical protein MNBD_GAMMA07-758 [hydrothermal vent metagenome]|uniref:Uncharacterized protein n=1 Tax=hydrothermal vent metagenome TaxID=652676 RepID=A0A3B0WTY1_9ZZZZ